MQTRSLISIDLIILYLYQTPTIGRQMIVSNQLKEHLKGPKAFYVGSRDKDFNCDIIRGLGAGATGHDTVKFYVAEKTARKMLDNLRSNKLVNLSVTQIFTSESYQFKGRFLSAKPVNEDESKAVLEYVGQFEEAVSTFGLKPGLIADNLLYKPALAIEFVVDQIFDQTPKIGTGQKLSVV